MGSINEFCNSKIEENCYGGGGCITTQIRKNVPSEGFVNTDLYLCQNPEPFLKSRKHAIIQTFVLLQRGNSGRLSVI